MSQPAIAYIDGFNFYFGAVRDRPGLKWLDLQAMCEALVRGCDVRGVRYYTARVDDRPDDPTQSQRQDVYLRALATLPKLTIVYGQFKTRTRAVALAGPAPPTFVKARITQEKGSDVNLATDLVWDACHGAVTVALVISNDLDLERPVARVMEAGIKVVTVNPHRHHGQKPGLHGTETRRLSRWHLAKHQLPDRLTSPDGRTIARPPEWR